MTAESEIIMQKVIKNREKILILERLLEELVNNGSVNQRDYLRIKKSVKAEVRRDFELL
ncbi:MAG: hypothetical protein BalsKO_21740 [Balneolaceae bacterium]